MNSKETTTERLEQAALWWLRLREESVRPEEISEWLDWCQRDPDNLQAFEKIEGLSARFDALDADTRAGMLREMLDEPLAEPVPAAVPFVPARRRYAVVALAAGFAALAVAIGAYTHLGRGGEVNQTASYTTAKAQIRDLLLADGSQVVLGAATRLDVDYTAGVRGLQLGDGEAYFEVAHNPQRPFVVRVGRLKVIAAGTAFNIRKTGARVEVVVTQGAIDVEDAARNAGLASQQTRLPNDGAIRVAAGQLVVTEREGLTVRPADRETATAWRHGSLQFVDEDLSVVVANLNRYSQQEVVIADRSLEGLRYTGTVMQGRESEWLAAIEQVFPIRVQRDAQGRINLRRRELSDATRNTG